MFYQRLGDIPAKRHVQFRRPDGSLYREEVMGVAGFAGIQSILYHHHQPTRLLRAEDLGDVAVKYADFGALRHRHFLTRDVPAGGDGVAGRTVLIGKSTFLSDRVRIVDWRNAPVSRIFYQYGEADEYDEELNGRRVSGEARAVRLRLGSN